MSGSKGNIVITLPKPAKVHAVTIDRSSESNDKSVPKKFRVVGIEAEGDGQVDLGKFNYRLTNIVNGEQINKQTFRLHSKADTQEMPVLKSIKVEVESNYGNKDYTCIYRLQVWAE